MSRQGLMSRPCLAVEILTAGLLAGPCWSAAAAGEPDRPVPVRKVAEDFQQAAWVPDQWSTAKGRTALVAEPGPDGAKAGSLKVEAIFSGNGFEHFTADPPAPLWIPGDAKRVTLRYKISDGRYALKLGFIDGWGRDQVGGTYLAWDLRTDVSGDWKTATFQVPAAWVRPLRLSGITTHNWEARNAKNTVHIQVGPIEVETDIRGVDPKTGTLAGWRPEPKPANPARALHECPRTPLVSVDMTSGQECNVFAGSRPRVQIGLRNWKPGKLTGKLSCRLLDAAGSAVERFERPVSVDSSAGVEAPLAAARFGLYTLDAHLTLSDGTDRAEQMILACLPPGSELSGAEKLASPYGLNVHSGDKTVLVPFRKAGIVWFREYAFSYDWLLRARGDDGRYAGWPNYPRIVTAYLEAGGECLPVLQQSMRPPEPAAGKPAGRVGPDRQWTRNICNIINAFPQIAYWELNNEYDLSADHWKLEEPIDWANYRAYHKQFAGILHLLGGGELTAVENGRAGIWPERVRRCVRSGDFDGVAVVNSHHYCGTDAPETCLGNFNMGAESKRPSLLFDDLRAVKLSARADGKPRQSWLTEFGWDTLAGPAVSPYQQAVFLPRAWMLALAAGTDKAFWFYNFDAPAPKQFFDGCGLLGANGEPKLALCSLAGLTSVLPNPQYVGDLDADDNTCGYVFASNGKLVAALWNIHGDDGPSVRFQAERLQDYLGNELPPGPVRLSMAPVYAVGLSKSDAWYHQTAYSLETPHLVAATPGDEVHALIRIANNRGAPIDCKVRSVLPDGWQEGTEVPVRVPAGDTRQVAFPFTVSPDASLGFHDARFIVSEGRQIKQMAMRVLVEPPLSVEVGPMAARPGKSQVTVRVGNRSASPLSGILRMRLPRSWQALTPEIPIENLAAHEVRPLVCKFQWTADWKPQETAEIEVDCGPGKRLTRPLIPGQYAIHRAGKIKLDGKLTGWTPATQLPAWMLGSTAGESKATLHLAWAKEGLYGAVVVHDSKLQVKDPQSFWAGDVLELFLDTADSKEPRRAAAGDHQFWLVPLVDAGRVYLGRWKMKDEIPATQYDIAAVRGIAARTADGYVMEFLLPAELIENYHPEAGRALGLNLNLTIQGKQGNREAYWPGSKAAGATVHPDRWGTVLLAE
jgi:hypothetical protein